MQYKRKWILRLLGSILLLAEVIVLSGCIRIRTSLPPDYKGIDEFAEYVNSNADIEPLYWGVDIDKDEKIVNIFIEMKNPEPYSKIDSIRIAANDFLTNNPEYFLNNYLMRIWITTDDPQKLYYAKFSNSEDLEIPYQNDNGKPEYDSLCAVEVLVSEDDLEYISGLDDIVSIRFHPANPNETLMIGCCETVSSMDCLTDVYVIGDWYDYFEDSDLECTVHDWTWN